MGHKARLHESKRKQIRDDMELMVGSKHCIQCPVVSVTISPGGDVSQPPQDEPGGALQDHGGGGGAHLGVAVIAEAAGNTDL